MGTLADNIRQAVSENRYIFGAHADQRLRRRRILGWQVVAGVATAKLLSERPDAAPNPVAEFEQVLPDGEVFKAVWAWLARDRIAKLITVHYFDR